MKLIDILNKIANGELKEGTKVIHSRAEYTYQKSPCSPEEYDLYIEDRLITIFDNCYLSNLNDEVELIEPQEPTECEHEWEEYGMYNTKTKEDKHFRKCIKCDLEEEIEPTDNTKIEELDKEEMLCLTLQCAIAVLTDKLNEVIRKLNKENNNE